MAVKIRKMIKGRSLPVGTERTWANGKRMKKQPDGGWKEVKRETQPQARKEFMEHWKEKYSEPKQEKAPPAIIKINTNNKKEIEAYFGKHGIPKVDDVVEIKGGTRLVVSQITDWTKHIPFEGKKVVRGGKIVRLFSNQTGKSWDIYVSGLESHGHKNAKEGEYWVFQNDDTRRKVKGGWEQWDTKTDSFIPVKD